MIERSEALYDADARLCLVVHFTKFDSYYKNLANT